MKTVNRGTLKKLVEQGKMEVVESYSFCDMMGESRQDKVSPVRLRGQNGVDYIYEQYNLFESDFKSSCGRAWENEDGTITLYIHSNKSVTMRRKK